MEFKKTKDSIRYLHDYYPKSSDQQDDVSRQILDFKRGDREALKQFTLEMQFAMESEFAENLDILKNTVICVIPSHEAGKYGDNLLRMASHLAKFYSMKDGSRMVERTLTHEKLATGGTRNVIHQMETMRLRFDYEIAGKNIIILDDIATTGNSMEAVRRLFRPYKVGIIYAIAIGKTIWEESTAVYFEKKRSKANNGSKTKQVTGPITNPRKDPSKTDQKAKLIANKPADDPNLYILREKLNEALALLREKEKRILELRYGILDGKRRTLQEVGATFDVSRERIRQIEAKALRKLGSPKRISEIKPYVDADLEIRDILIGLADGTLIVKKPSENSKTKDQAEDHSLDRTANMDTSASRFEESPIAISPDMGIERLGLSNRSYNCLKRAGISTIEDLCSYTANDLRRVRDLGRKSEEEIHIKLKEAGFWLRKE